MSPVGWVVTVLLGATALVWGWAICMHQSRTTKLDTTSLFYGELHVRDANNTVYDLALASTTAPDQDREVVWLRRPQLKTQQQQQQSDRRVVVQFDKDARVRVRKAILGGGRGREREESVCLAAGPSQTARLVICDARNENNNPQDDSLHAVYWDMQYKKLVYGTDRRDVMYPVSYALEDDADVVSYRNDIRNSISRREIETGKSAPVDGTLNVPNTLPSQLLIATSAREGALSGLVKWVRL